MCMTRQTRKLRRCVVNAQWLVECLRPQRPPKYVESLSIPMSRCHNCKSNNERQLNYFRFRIQKATSNFHGNTYTFMHSVGSLTRCWCLNVTASHLCNEYRTRHNVTSSSGSTSFAYQDNFLPELQCLSPICIPFVEHKQALQNKVAQVLK